VGGDRHAVAGGSLMARSGSVLVVDDEFLVVELLSTMLQDIGLDVCGTAATADRAVALAEAYSPGLVLMDVRLNGYMDGIDAAATIRRTTGASVIFITGSVDRATVARIERLQPAAVLAKPVRFDQLRNAVLETVA
jgi:DNA-binding NarL/FixJ family response regulator